MPARPVCDLPQGDRRPSRVEALDAVSLVGPLDDGDGAVFFVFFFFEEELKKRKTSFFPSLRPPTFLPPSSPPLSETRKRMRSKKTRETHPESEPGFEVTAAVTRKVIGAMTTVWHAPPPAPASVPARPRGGERFGFDSRFEI